MVIVIHKYLECHEKSRQRCSARGVKNSESPVVSLTKDHNHGQNYDTELIYNFKYQLYHSVTSSTHDLRIIYNEISIRHSRASALVPYISITRTKCIDGAEAIVLQYRGQWKNTFSC
ncbi:hypothetical protein KQX54_001644 [Cotesia glomerata]|uniref:Uncharacterized protein n=1 Tax=Cotesia glomerata TaxID=32391 RepID=A0AAV7IWI7_COTGL|nr:hypothetical protein KQX54_001644 [Cotesia glomerata]